MSIMESPKWPISTAQIKDAVNLCLEVEKLYKNLAGLIVEAQHRVTKKNRPPVRDRFICEDYTGKSEFMLWEDDYTRYSFIF